MKRILIRGPLLTQSGYGVHSRQVFKWALKQGYDITCQVLPWGITPWYINSDKLDGLIGEIMKRTTPPSGVYDASVQIQLPNEWDPSISKINIGVTAAVETTHCNPLWIDACNKMSAVVVPSHFTKEVLENSGDIKVPLEVIPESFPEKFDQPLKQSNFFKSTKTKSNFLLFGQLTSQDTALDRKNTFNTIKVFCETFKDKKNVGLIVKTNMGTNSTLDKRLSLKMLQAIVSSVRKGKYPKVQLLHGNLNEDELFKMYNDKSLVSLVSGTRGEGYGLPIIEAASCGLHIIATDWSGHKTFLKPGCWSPVKYKLTQIPNNKIDNNIFMGNSSWAEADQDDLSNNLKRVLKNSKTLQNNNNKQREYLLKNFCQAEIEDRYNKILMEL